MSEKLPYVGKIVKNGNSYQIVVPANIREHLQLQKGDMIKVEISVLDSTGNPKNAVNWILSGDLLLSEDLPVCVP